MTNGRDGRSYEGQIYSLLARAPLYMGELLHKAGLRPLAVHNAVNRLRAQGRIHRNSAGQWEAIPDRQPDQLLYGGA